MGDPLVPWGIRDEYRYTVGVVSNGGGGVNSIIPPKSDTLKQLTLLADTPTLLPWIMDYNNNDFNINDWFAVSSYR